MIVFRPIFQGTIEDLYLGELSTRYNQEWGNRYCINHPKERTDIKVYYDKELKKTVHIIEKSCCTEFSDRLNRLNREEGSHPFYDDL